MQNVILSLPSRVSPEAQAAGSPDALKTGHINYGKDVFDTFGNDDSQNFKVNRVQAWAEALTCDQFAEACKSAMEMADAQDLATGFVIEPGAKGVDKYGPVRKVLNTRVSEAKTLFGTFKREPSLLKEKGYWQAIQAGRDYLDAQNIKWDGTPKPTQEQKKARKANKEMEAALAATREQNPQQPGESIRDYMLRIADLADVVAENMEVDKIVASIVKLHTDKDTLFSGIFEFLKAQGAEQMEFFAQDLFEEAMKMKGIKQG